MGPVLLHEPLIALANGYDEARYSACFDLYRSARPTVGSHPEQPVGPVCALGFLDARGRSATGRPNGSGGDGRGFFALRTR